MPQESVGRLWPVLRLVLGSTVIGLLALQVWRPFYFLTDDNATCFLPMQVEVLRNLLAGKPPLLSETLFGGGYHWETDIGVFPVLSPFAFLFAWVVWTPWPYAIIDVVSSCTLLAVAVSFCACAHWLRRSERLPLTDRLLVVATLSYTFAPYHLLMGASWIGYLNAQAAWPVLFVALRLDSLKRAAVLVAGALGFCVFGGNFHALSFVLLGAGVWSAAEAVRQRTWRPLFALGLGGAVCLAAIWVFFGDPQASLANADGVRKLVAHRGVKLNLTPVQLGASVMLGPLSTGLVTPAALFGASPVWAAAVGCTLVGLPTLLLVFSPRRRSATEWMLLAGAGLMVLIVWRPEPIQEFFRYFPLLRSLRWPFREISVLIALLHLSFLLSWRPATNAGPLRLTWAYSGLLMLFCLAGGPPTFAEHGLSRRLIFSPNTAAYWEELKPLLSGRPTLAALSPALPEDYERFPLPLLAAPNFSALYDVVYAGGNSTTSRALLDPTIQLISTGGRSLASGPRLAAYLERRPQTNLFLMHQLKPAIWSLHIPGQKPRYFELDEETLAVRSLPGPIAPPVTPAETPRDAATAP